jgi:hypothetical protein
MDHPLRQHFAADIFVALRSPQALQGTAIGDKGRISANVVKIFQILFMGKPEGFNCICISDNKSRTLIAEIAIGIIAMF